MSLIQVSNLTFAYEGSHENIFENVSFQIDTNWRLGFVGRNGRGKTTFLNLLLGKYDYQGSISASVTFSYFPYSVEDKSILAIDAVEAMYPEYEYWKIQREMANLQLDDGVLYRPYDILSNGEQTKLQLAVLFSDQTQMRLARNTTLVVKEVGAAADEGRVWLQARAESLTDRAVSRARGIFD